MKSASFAPAYVAIYPMLAEIARECGYSLAVHGSVGRDNMSDIDFVAVPWIDGATSADVLIGKIAKWIVGMFNIQFVNAMKGLEPEEKPHGRLAYRIPCGNGSAIDISVIKTGV